MTRAEARIKSEWVTQLSELSDYLEYYTPAELRGLLERYEHEGGEFWDRAVTRFQEEFGDTVFGYIVDFTHDGDIDRIAAVIADCEKREITLVGVDKWAEQQGLEREIQH